MRGITTDSEIKLYTWDDEEGRHAFWHSSAHLMAEALQAIYPNIKFGIGPAIENGFYYDVDPGEGVAIQEKIWWRSRRKCWNWQERTRSIAG